MAVYVKKDRILPILRREYGAIDTIIAGLSESDWNMSSPLPGWTVRDVVAHIIGTEEMLNGAPIPKVDITISAHLRNDIGRTNELWVESMRSLSGAAMVERYRTIIATRLAALDAMDQEGFDAPSWTPAGPDETYGRFMRIRHFDCYLHELDIRAALGMPDPDDAEALDEALTEPEAALGYIVGRRAKMPAGTHVEIRLAGSVEKRWLVEVAERANVVDAFADGAAATTSIELPGILFLRLGGGRLEAEPYLGTDITFGGDETLARQLATHLAYTI